LPELPDVVLYIEALRTHTLGQRLEHLQLISPFVLRSVEPPIESITGLTVQDIQRSGKRILIRFGDDLFLVLHLMIAGRLRWREPGRKPGIGPRLLLASFVMTNGTLLFTEASSRKRASMQLVRGGDAVRALDRGGIEPLEASVEMFREALTRENHTLKRGLTDPRLFSGIGNAYSDEILHAARLSPLKLTRSLSNEDVHRLHSATRDTLLLWKQGNVCTMRGVIAVEQRVAICGGLGHYLHCDCAARPGAVLDHHLLAESHAQELADASGANIGGAARWERNDKFNGFGRVTLSRGK